RGRRLPDGPRRPFVHRRAGGDGHGMDRPLRAIFDEDAERYDRARPGYPAELFADLAALTGLRPGDRVLEVGPGTGQATVPLAKRGYRVRRGRARPTPAPRSSPASRRSPTVGTAAGSSSAT